MLCVAIVVVVVVMALVVFVAVEFVITPAVVSVVLVIVSITIGVAVVVAVSAQVGVLVCTGKLRPHSTAKETATSTITGLRMCPIAVVPAHLCQHRSQHESNCESPAQDTGKHCQSTAGLVPQAVLMSPAAHNH
jgi:hypothetical protein